MDAGIVDGRVGRCRGNHRGWNCVGAQRFESSFRYRSAVIFGVFERVPDADKVDYLERLTDSFIPGRAAELRASTRKELAATLPLRMPIAEDNWSLKISGGWPEDPQEDIAGDAWGVSCRCRSATARRCRPPTSGRAFRCPRRCGR